MRNTHTPERTSSRLDIRNNPNEFFENDNCIINLNEESIEWKAGMFDPKLRNDIMFWLTIRNQKS